MSKKALQSQGGIVYSTNPDYKTEVEVSEPGTPEASKQLLRVLLDRKQRAGKSVTLITGFEGTQKDIEELGRKIKTYCGTGGSVKDGEIIIQGDNREKIMLWLVKNGFLKTKKV